MQTFLYGTSWTPDLFLSKLVYSYRTKAGFQISLFQTFPYESIVNHTISVYRNQTDENNTFILSHPYKTIEHCDKTVKLLWLFYRSVLAVLDKTAKTELCDFVVCDCSRLVSILRACTKIFMRQSCCSQWERVHAGRLYLFASLCDINCKFVDVQSNENMNQMTNKDIHPLISFRRNELQQHWNTNLAKNYNAELMIYVITSSCTVEDFGQVG